MKLELFTFAEYAANTQDNKLVVAGIFNTLNIQRVTTPPFGDAGVLPLPTVYLAAVLTASIGEGLRHAGEIRVVNEDGHQVFQAIQLGTFNFQMNSAGRPMRFQAVIAVGGLPMPGPGEFSFELWVSGQSVGCASLYVDDAIKA